MKEKRIIEINGVKLEVDLSQATVIENYRIGMDVKVLIKKYEKEYTSYPGVIVGFDNFKVLPTIVIAYADIGYSEANIKFAFLNASTKDVEICPMIGAELAIQKGRAVEMFEKEIEKAKRLVQEFEMKRDYFLSNFGRFFIEQEAKAKN